MYKYEQFYYELKFNFLKIVSEMCYSIWKQIIIILSINTIFVTNMLIHKYLVFDKYLLNKYLFCLYVICKYLFS